MIEILISLILSLAPIWINPRHKKTASGYAVHISRESQQHNIDPILTLSVIAYESRFRPQAVSRRGALGLMQVMPCYARTRRAIGKNGHIMNPRDNIKAGVSNLAYWRDFCGVNLQTWLGAYNSGKCKPNGYSKQVMKLHARLTTKAKTGAER